MTEIGGAVDCLIENVRGADKACVSALITDRAFLSLLPESLRRTYASIAARAEGHRETLHRRDRFSIGRNNMVRVHIRHMWAEYGVRSPVAGDLIMSWEGGEAPVCAEHEHEWYVAFYSGMVVRGTFAAKADLDSAWPLLVLHKWTLKNGAMPPMVTVCPNRHCPGYWKESRARCSKERWPKKYRGRLIPGWTITYGSSPDRPPAISAGVHEVLSTWPRTMVIVHGIAHLTSTYLPSRLFPRGWERSSAEDLGAHEQEPTWPQDQ